MSVTKTQYEHIVHDEDGVPMIEGTRTKVLLVAADHVARDWSAAKIHEQHPYLSLGQIHSALAYYYDHKGKLDADMQRRTERVEASRKQMPEPELAKRLRARKQQQHDPEE